MRIATQRILLIIAVVICEHSLAQDAETLNRESKELLTNHDIKNAIPLLKQAAELGSAEAQYNLGYYYQQGSEVSQNDSIANTWLIKSAKQGYKDAQFKMAYSYAVGRGIKKDYKQAFYWALQCAEQKDPECMYNVIGCYREGMGVNKNSDSMLTWAIRLGSLEDLEDLKQSAHITGARLNLAKMYRDGNKVPVDLAKSYMWYLIYNESKRDFSILEQQTQIDAIKELETRFTVSSRQLAKENAEKLLKRGLKNFTNLYIQDF
jgi:hypothetical protein